MPAAEHRKARLTAGPSQAGLLVAGAVLLATLLVHLIPGASESLQWQRNDRTLLSGLTGHLCHWSWNHLAWDLFAFGLLSLLAWRTAPGRYIPGLLLAAVVIPLEIRLNQPRFDCYRGLSGLDCALFGLVVAALWKPVAGGQNGLASKILAVLAGVGFLAKTLHEFRTGHPLFVETGSSAAFVPALSSHLTGFACGVVAGLWPAGSAGSGRSAALDRRARQFRHVPRAILTLAPKAPGRRISRMPGLQGRTSRSQHTGCSPQFRSSEKQPSSKRSHI